MAWTVVRETENGEPQSNYTEFEVRNSSVYQSADYKLLKYLDPYGDTVFNKLMLDDLLADLSIAKAKNLASNKAIDEAITLAIACKNDLHSYLKFYGD